MLESDKSRAIQIVSGVLKETPIRKKGTVAFHCPRCNHRKHKLEYQFSTGIFHCWTCDYSGRIQKLLGQYGGGHYISEMNEIYKNTKSYNKTPEEDDDKRIFLPKEFKPLWIPSKDIEYKHALLYCKRRGLNATDIIKYGLGYCVDGDFRGRVIIPSYDDCGSLNFYTGRSWYPDTKLKYRNCEESKNIIGFDLFINWSVGWITICEGPLDAISIKRNTIPLFGKTLSTKLKQKIIVNGINRVNVVLDNDEPGKKAIIRISEDLMNEGISVYTELLSGKDPSEIGFNGMCGIIKNMKQLDFSSLMKLKMI